MDKDAEVGGKRKRSKCNLELIDKKAECGAGFLTIIPPRYNALADTALSSVITQAILRVTVLIPGRNSLVIYKIESVVIYLSDRSQSPKSESDSQISHEGQRPESIGRSQEPFTAPGVRLVSCLLAFSPDGNYHTQGKWCSKNAKKKIIKKRVWFPNHPR
jgi:hypothetical protein